MTLSPTGASLEHNLLKPLMAQCATLRGYEIVGTRYSSGSGETCWLMAIAAPGDIETDDYWVMSNGEFRSCIRRKYGRKMLLLLSAEPKIVSPLKRKIIVEVLSKWREEGKAVAIGPEGHQPA